MLRSVVSIWKCFLLGKFAYKDNPKYLILVIDCNIQEMNHNLFALFHFIVGVGENQKNHVDSTIYRQIMTSTSVNIATIQTIAPAWTPPWTRACPRWGAVGCGWAAPRPCMPLRPKDSSTTSRDGRCTPISLQCRERTPRIGWHHVSIDEVNM